VLSFKTAPENAKLWAGIFDFWLEVDQEKGLKGFIAKSQTSPMKSSSAP